MERGLVETPEYRELLRIVRGVRYRWRLKLALRGAAILTVTGLTAFLLGALALERLGLTPGAVLGTRVVLAALAATLLYLLVLRPVRRPVTDEQVALYLQEREPSLGAALVSALDAGAGSQAFSGALARRTVALAVERCRKVHEGRTIEAPHLRRSYAVLGAALAAALLLAVVPPEFVRVGARAIFLPLPAAEAAPVVRVSVAPGDTAIARGADLRFSAALLGLTGETVELVTQVAADSAVQRYPMFPATEHSGYEIRLFGLDASLDYYVEADGVRSPLHRVSVLDLPYVGRMEVEIRFPAYTGIEPRRVENGGDIVALEGSVARLRAFPTMPVERATVEISDGRRVELTLAEDGSLTGEFTVRGTGLYHVSLQQSGGAARVGSPEYLIQTLPDAPPTVRFNRPVRDVNVTSLEEVYVEATASDDYGVRALELVYSVNGGPERTLPLYTARPMQEVSAGHTFYLEEYELQAGDFVSYYARARDVGPAPRPDAVSDMYFIEIRPFGRDVRQADAGGGGGGGQDGQDGADVQLSRRQRELISATFNILRDRESADPGEYRENLAALAEAQSKLKEQAETLVRRIANRGAVRDTTFDLIARTLPLAAAEMELAAQRLRALEPDSALPAEQRALLHLQRAEAAFREVQVSLGQDQGSGRGGGSTAEDLADLFGLELDKLRNQYETLQRSERQQAASEVDSSIDRVRELARRLERQAEEQRRALANRTRSDGGGSGQRQLAEETLEEARRLERLSREQSRPDLMDAANRLREAAEALQRSAADGRSGSTASSEAALERLREATRRLERERSSGVRQDAQQAAETARRLAEQQRQIGQQMQQLASGEAAGENVVRMLERKVEQAEEVTRLERQLDQLANEARTTDPEASRQLREAAETIRRNQVQERIRASRAATRPGTPPEFIRQLESEIQQGLDEVRQRTEQAARQAAAGPASGDELLDRARNLVRGMESMQQRAEQGREAAGREPGGEGEAGANDRALEQLSTRLRDGEREPQQGAAQGQQGQQGQEGQQGQPGQDGQQGQQGSASESGGAAGGDRAGSFADGARGGARGWGAEDVRQFRGEVRQRLAEAEQLRDQLRAEGLETGELDRVLDEMRRLDDPRSYSDFNQLGFLQTSLLDRLKEFEFRLRQQMRADEARRLFLSGSRDVPAEYRELVDEYYRELARTRR